MTLRVCVRFNLLTKGHLRASVGAAKRAVIPPLSRWRRDIYDGRSGGTLGAAPYQGNTMLPKSNVMTTVLLVCSLVASLTGCASSNGPALPGLADRVELNGVPFYRGNANQSGSMVLASMLSQQGITITPGLLDPALKLPAETDRLQQNISQVARDYGLLVYALDPQLNALLTQVAAGNPVLLRYSEGSAFWSQPRYALLVGYDRFKRHVLLRSGMNRRLPMDFDSFDSAWKSAGAWAILVQQPNQLPAKVDRQRWLDAARDTAAAGQEPAAARARKALGS
jgi:hypothetical protein